MLDVPPERALDEIIVLCETARETYLASSRLTSDSDLATLFTTLGSARGEMTVRLRGRSRPFAARRASSPRRPRRFVGLIRTIWPGDHRRALIEDCEYDDRLLARRLVDADNIAWPETLATSLRYCLGEVTAALGLLAAARTRLM